MFKKILIVNRGEIAVRIARTCREMGIQTVALYEASDQGSLHVRLADECVLLGARAEFTDADTILRIAREKGADAIHPGYGFLAEEAGFIRACDAAGIAFIGPPADVVEPVRDKIQALERASAAGFTTTEHSRASYGDDDFDALRAEADRLGYPITIKSCHGGRGRGECVVRAPERLAEWVRRARGEAQAVYGDHALYLEKAILPAHQVAVQIIADRHGQMIHVGEREGSLILGNQKIVIESPAPCLTPEQRERLWQTALDLMRLFHYQNVGNVEFLVDDTGKFYFTEIKARIQMEHPLTEMVARLDLVREQIRIAAGEPLNRAQSEVRLQGCTIEGHLLAEDPSQNFLPSPGRLRRVRLPSGPEVRVDTYAYSGCDVPFGYAPLIAKLIVWGPGRDECRQRMERVLDEIKLTGTATNVALLQQIVRSPAFVAGKYTTQTLARALAQEPVPPTELRDLAVAGAIFYTRANQVFRPTMPDRLLSGWHRDSRSLPR